MKACIKRLLQSLRKSINQFNTFIRLQSQRLCERYRRSTKKQRMTLYGVLIVIIMGSIVFHVLSLKQQKHSQQAINAAILNQVQISSASLSELEVKLSSLQQSLTENTKQVDMNVLRESLKEATTSLKSINEEQHQSIVSMIQDSGTLMKQKLDQLQQDVTAIKGTLHKVTYLDVDALPFSVQSIDLIQQQEVVTIFYDYKTQPMDIGYAIAGWQLISADYSQQRAEFKNAQDEHVVVNVIR